MKVLVVKEFRDNKEGVVRKKGDTFSCTKERFEEINNTKFGKLVKEIEEEKKEKPKK